MQRFFQIYVEVLYLVLLYPSELPTFLNRIPRMGLHLLLSSLFAALSISVGIYSLRESFTPSAFLQLPLLFLVALIALLFGGALLGSLTDALVQFQRPERGSGHTWQMVTIAILSQTPLYFYYPAAAVAGLFSFSNFLLLPLILLLLFWSMVILVKGLQYLYEVPIWLAVRTLLISALTIFLFPPAMLTLLALQLHEMIF